MQIRKRNASLVCRSIACSFNFSQAPGGKLRKKKSNTIPCLGQVLTCLGQRQVKLHTLFRTARPKNHTLSSGTSPYSPNKGVTPSPPRAWDTLNAFLLLKLERWLDYQEKGPSDAIASAVEKVAAVGGATSHILKLRTLLHFEDIFSSI